MSQGESPIERAFEAAQGPIAEAAAVGITEVANELLALMRSAVTYRQRGQYATAQIRLIERRAPLLSAFREALRSRVAAELEPLHSEPGEAAATDWEAMSLVDEEQIEDRLSSERIGQLISHECEAELRELARYTGTMLRVGWADPDRNPLRGSVVGAALHEAIEQSIDEEEVQRILLKQIAAPFARALPVCYRAIVADFERRGFDAAGTAIRTPQPPAGSRPPPTFEEARALWERSIDGRPPQDAADTVRSWESSILGRYGSIDPIPADFDPESSAALLERLIRGGLPGSPVPPSPARPAGPAPGDAELMSLLRRLNADDRRGRPESGDSGRTGLGATSYGYPAGSPPPSGSGSPAAAGSAPGGGVRALMAANLIRAHRDELAQATRGKLDHLVIEVVASLFDQILSDARVAPQLARQIARLQLPVLRVALKDPTFFSSRRHPVRRFINRVSTLAAGFDELASGAGSRLLDRVAALITEIVEGDFDQIDTYNDKLGELERFVQEQTRSELEASPAAATLHAKEAEWGQQQQFSARLLAALEPLAIPAYLKEFIAGIWSRVILAVSQRDGEDSAAAQRFRKAAFDLVASVQPKRSLEQRSRFLSTLPGLMATLNEGMQMVDWPEHDNTGFFGKLLAEHAGSLKTAPASELAYNLLLRGVEAAARTPLPRSGEALAPPLPAIAGPAIEPRFSAEEAGRLGLIAESEVDWQGRVAISAEDMAEEAFSSTLPPLDDDEPGPLAGQAEAAAGSPLREHLQLGTAYQLHLTDRWEPVRLSYMSPARTMFLFKHGAGDQATISMTARTLARLCETGRLRALERAPLLDRATSRARHQLAMLAPLGGRKPAG